MAMYNPFGNTSVTNDSWVTQNSQGLSAFPTDNAPAATPSARGGDYFSGRSGAQGVAGAPAPPIPSAPAAASTPPVTQNPAVPATAGSPSAWWQESNPWAQNVSASINGQQTNWATPGAPNINYTTQDAAQRLGQMFGGNVVAQNLTNMASPGSSAPSAPMYGLDFGNGFVANTGPIAFALQRGDTPEQIQARLRAEAQNTGWGGPAPTVNYGDLNWVSSRPLARNDSPEDFAPSAKPFGFDQFMKNLSASQNPASVTGPSAPSAPNYQEQILPYSGSYQTGGTPYDQTALLGFILSLLGGSATGLGNTTRRPNLTAGRNTSLQRNYYYPRSEPRYY